MIPKHIMEDASFRASVPPPTTVPKDGIEVTHHLDGSKTTTTCAIARRPVPFTGEIPPDWTGYNSCTDMDTGDFVEHFYPC